MRRNSIGAFPNTSLKTTVFNQLSDLDVSQLFGFRNQENNNQTQILKMAKNSFSKYFDVLLVVPSDGALDANPIMKFDVLTFADDDNDEKVVLLTKDITDIDDAAAIDATAKDIARAAAGRPESHNADIPLLKRLMTGAASRPVIRVNADGALSVIIDDNNLMKIKKQTLMAILNVVFNFDDFDDLDSKRVDNASDHQIIATLKMMMMMNSNNKKLTNNCNLEINTDNINFSYYCDDDDEYYEIIFNCWCPSYDELMAMMECQQRPMDDGSDEERSSTDAGYLMISHKMQLKCQESLLQSFKESDQQSGIVSNNSCNTMTKLTINLMDAREGDACQQEMQKKMKQKKVEEMTIESKPNIRSSDMIRADAGNQPKNISEKIFSHINDKNDLHTLIVKADNTVNITCDFNYLNYKIKNKINDQIHKDNASVKDKSCYNNKSSTTKSTEEESKPTTTNYTQASSLVDKKKTSHSVDELIECQRREAELMRHFPARRMRLCGGGEGSLSGASGWGSPPSNTSSNQAPANSNNPNAGQWGATAQQTPQQSWNQAAQQPAAGQSQQVQQPNPVAPGQPGQQQQQPGQAQNPKPLTPGGPSGGWNQPPQAQIPNPAQQQQVPQQVPGNGAPGIVGGGTSAVAAKNQLEQLNSMREALFAQDGWGCANVNQDTNWDVPGSPEPGPRTGDPAGATQWKSHIVNNGTDLWEANLRNGGQPPPQPVQKTPWNHTPVTNIGGTWGEDDESAENNQSVWAGNQNPQTPGWNQGSGANAAAGGTAMWPAANPGVGGVNANIPKKDEWGGATQGSASNWGDPRETMRPNVGAGPIDMRNIDPRDPRAPGTDMRMMDAREPGMQGNVRGVTGRLNGSSEMWQHGGMGAGHGGQVPGMNKIVGPGAAAVNNPQWPGSQVGGPKDIEMNKPGWGETSPPAARRPMGTGDDGTSLWGTGRGGQGNVDANWKQGGQDPRNNFGRNPIGGGGVGGAGPGNFPPNRLPGAGMKPDGSTWSGLHPGGARNSWDDPHTPNWEDKSPHMGSGGITPWNENPAVPMWNKNKPSWPENNDIGNEWPQPNKLSNASSEIIRSSKQFRILVESGFKKEDAELALRSTNMNIDEAMELLQQQARNSGIDQSWNHQGGGAFDHPSFPGNRYPGPQTMPFPPNNPKLPNSSGAGPGANLGGLNNLPMQLNKHLPHQAGTPAFTQQTAAAASQSGAGGQQPSAHHLRNLVQQIQKAVQAGYLNHQILNQPLAPQTLQLLNSLLNTIQQLQYTQQSIQRNGGVNSIQLQMTIQKQKQQISQLQSQIAQQQNIYIKSQAAGSGGAGIGSGNEFLRQNSSNNMGMGVGNHNDPIGSIDNNLAGLSLKQEPSPYPTNSTSQQSRLNQWKLPSALDNKSGDPVDFSRAPGTTSKQSLPPTTPTSISSIGIHNEPGTWSSGRTDAGGWPDSSIEPDNKDWPASNQSPAFTDLVPEFQPGKPWKGTQKNIEDDPSITPGSVARNPLSISAAKESDLFGNNTAKTSPNEILSSSTWSFNPSTTTQQNFSSTMPKLGAEATKTNSWSDSTSDLWAAPSKTAGPPPGLGASKNGSTPATSEANDWIGWNSSNSTNSSGNGTWFSTWLLLKNLTAQIDGSTLRTLCVQHGPLQHFHLYLNHGIALCKYNSREEASKAQQALNNCVLSNTTICAESPSESEVQNILQHLGVPSGSQSGGNGGNGNGAAAGAGGNSATWRSPTQQGPARTGSDSTWGSSDWPATNSAINW